MQNRELNTCKQDIYSFLHSRLPTNTEPCGSAPEVQPPSRQKKLRSISRLTGVLRTRSGNRTRTTIAGHRILSPACLPIPPSELIINNKIKIKKYYYSKNNIKERRANNLYDISNNGRCNIIFIRMSNSTCGPCRA